MAIVDKANRHGHQSRKLGGPATCDGQRQRSFVLTKWPPARMNAGKATLVVRTSSLTLSLLDGMIAALRRNRISAGLLLIFTLLLCSCGLSNKAAQAEVVLIQYFQCLATNGYESAATLYGSEFYASINREEWPKKLKSIVDTRGAYRGFGVQRGRVIMKSGTTAGSGLIVVLECNVSYAKCSTKEFFTLRKGPQDPDFQIIGQNFKVVKWSKATKD